MSCKGVGGYAKARPRLYPLPFTTRRKEHALGLFHPHTIKSEGLEAFAIVAHVNIEKEVIDLVSAVRVMAFLASDDSTFVSGRGLLVDGGYVIA